MNEKNLRKLLGKALSDLRKEKGVSQKKLADYTDINRSYISDLERGKYHPSMLIIYKICDFFDMPAHELFEIIDKQIKK